MEYIIDESDKGIDWLCICGNTPGGHGFFPCDMDGNKMEPVIGSFWNDLYVCDRCDRVINQETLEVVGRKCSFE